MNVTTTDKKTITATMTVREAGKLKASLYALDKLPPVLQPLVDALADIQIPKQDRGELRHEWGDPLDMDPDIGPA